jgi:hypothetical protein
MAGHNRLWATAIVFILGLLHAGGAAGLVPGDTLPPGIPAAAASWTVYSTANGGSGSLREALEGAGNGDLITFDAGVFPPGSPASIYLVNALPELNQGNITLDASGAGVVLDGSGIPGDAVGLRIASQGNTVRGLQILHFPGGGVQIAGAGAENTVEGNTISSNGGACGLEILGARNVVVGNFIGTDATGTVDMGNSGSGLCIGDSAGNYIGPGNVIAHNGGVGIDIGGATATGNTVTQNSITANASDGIYLHDGGNGALSAPIITVCTDTSISGTAPPDCIIEVFSDADAEGKTYEGATLSDGGGVFIFTKPAGLTGPDITATATDSAGNTSSFSAAASVATEPTTWGGIKAGFD